MRIEAEAEVTEVEVGVEVEAIVVEEVEEVEEVIKAAETATDGPSRYQHSILTDRVVISTQC